jgi:hypothetical protein
VFVPSDVVRQAAAAVADREGLAEDWLNHAAKGFLPGPDPDARRFYSSDSLIVGVVFPPLPARDELFAARAEIKAAADRGGICLALQGDPAEDLGCGG